MQLFQPQSPQNTETSPPSQEVLVFQHHPSITDAAFSTYLQDASRNHSTYFTAAQLLVVSRPKGLSAFWKRRVLPFVGVLLLSFFFFLRPSFAMIILSLFLYASLFFLCFWTPKHPYTLDEMEGFLNAWEAAHGEVPFLLRSPSLAEPPPRREEEDVYAYGVEKIVIVERDILVDWLVKNGWHAAQRALVIAESGYPSYLVPKAKQLLREQPELPVFLLHDATEKGEAMLARLLASDRFGLRAHQGEIVDMGPTLEDTKRIKALRSYRKRAEARSRGILVDALPFGMLLLALTLSMTTGCSFGGALDDLDSPPVEDFG